jgi:RNA polymerase sigma factor (sigma-70 family)
MGFTELNKKITPVLKKIAYRLSAKSVLFGPDDLYQEAIMKLWLDFQAGKLNDKNQSYILQGCYFHLKNFLRKNYRESRFLSLEELLGRDTPNQAKESSILGQQESCRSQAHADFLLEAIRNNGLTAREKEVFFLALEGNTARGIGKRLGISHVRVVKLRANIREKCRRHIDIL